MALLMMGCPELDSEFHVAPPKPPPDPTTETEPTERLALGDACSLGDLLAERCTVGLGPCRVSGPPSCIEGEVVCALEGPSPELEACNAIDDDCDGLVDEGLTEPCCPAGRLDTQETCNGLDDDCDGHADEGIDACHDGQLSEACNGIDDDGDMLVDEGFPTLGEPCTVGVSICAASGVFECGPDGTTVVCSATENPPGIEDGTCDGIDDDCNGYVDDAPPCNGAPVGTTPLVPDFRWLDITAYPWVILPAGTYQRGSDGDVYPHETPAHAVVIEHHVMIASNEVTNAEWRAIAPERPLPAAHTGCPDCPVERVSWYEAVWFANQMTAWHNEAPRNRGLTACYVFDQDEQCEASDQIGAPCPVGDFEYECHGSYRCATVRYERECTGFRLLTSAEWEAAARAGTETLYWFGNDTSEVPANENCDTAGLPTEVPQSRDPNPFGLRHVLGNVAEWVFDGETDDLDPNRNYESAAAMMANGRLLTDPVAEPAGPWDGQGPKRYYRGHSPYASAEYCRSTSRRLVRADLKRSDLGFRLARTLRDAPAR